MIKFIKNIYPALIVAGFLAFVAPVFAAAPEWQLDPGSTVYTLQHTCTSVCAPGPYNHTMDVTSFDTTTGDFTATGFWNDDPSYTWTMTGNISQSAMNYVLTYTGTGAGFTTTATGSIDSDGDMSGTSVGSGGETINWTIEPNALPLFGTAVPSECSGMTFSNTIQGTNGNDTLTGTSGNDLIFGYAGNDTINGGAGNDCIVAGSGLDTVTGGSGDDQILGGDDNDTLTGNTGTDRILGEAGNDNLFGSSGNDTLTGGTGTDSANGESGIDSCDAETETNCEPS